MIIKNKNGEYEIIKKPKTLYGLNCMICGRVASEEHHCISASNRFKSDKLGLTVPLCKKCHLQLHNKGGCTYKQDMQKLAQEVFEREHTRAEWMAIFHKNYL